MDALLGLLMWLKTRLDQLGFPCLSHVRHYHYHITRTLDYNNNSRTPPNSSQSLATTKLFFPSASALPDIITIIQQKRNANKDSLISLSQIPQRQVRLQLPQPSSTQLLFWNDTNATPATTNELCWAAPKFHKDRFSYSCLSLPQHHHHIFLILAMIFFSPLPYTTIVKLHTLHKHDASFHSH